MPPATRRPPTDMNPTRFWLIASWDSSAMMRCPLRGLPKSTPERVSYRAQNGDPAGQGLAKAASRLWSTFRRWPW